MNTAKEIADAYAHGCMPHAEAERMYALRDAEIDQLAQKDVITINDIQKLERTGRVRVASELFERCNKQAQQALIADEHHFVRSAAFLAAKQGQEA